MLLRILALSVLFATTTSAAQERGDPDRGLNYARQVCAHCHAIRKGDENSPHHLAPSFEKIANSPGVTGIALAAILHSVHENMPNFVLSENERDNVIAYILSLKHER